jgi:cytochrome c-type biogenesis protein CcsB
LKLSNVLFNFKTTLILLAILAIGAGCATFIENDFGTSSARVLVYNNIWYETIINLIGMMIKFKMWKSKAKFIFHSSFVIILIGAAITRYVGYEGIMQIPEGSSENSMISGEPYLQVTIQDGDKVYYQEYQKEFTSFFSNINNFSHKILFGDKSVDINYKNFIFAKKDTAKMGLLVVDVIVDGKSQEIKLPGLRGQKGIQRDLIFDNVIVKLEYGSKIVSLPFSIKLNDFQLDRYPGSMSPSSYASEVTVVKENGQSYDYRIFMNRTLSEGNFLFFQSSYFPDETGTVLSVNNDPGKWPTYLGYFLLTFGLIMNFFDKKSRFRKLSKFVAEKNIASIVFALTLAFASTSLHAEEKAVDNSATKVVDDSTTKTVDYLNNLKNESLITSENFGKLVVQSNGGRMKPLSTLNREIIQKLTGRASLLGMTSDQLVLGMLSTPDVWKDVKMIKIQTPKLKNFLGVDEKEKYIAFSEVFKDGEYLLSQEAEKALQTKPIERGTYERDIIKVDERLNIMYSVFNGSLLNIYPKVKDGINANDNSKWYSPLEAIENFTGQNKTAVETITRGFINAIVEKKWEDADKFISMISIYQQKVGSDVILSPSKVEAEIFFNNLDIFFKLTLAYIILGLIMLIVAFTVIFKPDFKAKKITTVFFISLATLFAIHSFGMGYRWYLSGHAPWSNIYETLLYISWSAVFAGVIFFRRSLLALSAAVIIAGIFMFTAHLTDVDPQITNLVPVLKSYWLTIHVSILTASYGFFGLAAILGFLTLIMFIFRKNRPHIDDIIKHVVAIIEITLIIGLSAVTIGNFLGGVWANESWGRYWGWDPKETWAYVSIVVYAIVIHLRFVKSLSTPFVFATAALLSFSSILMTYLGVNFYLSGMHSYATGDPVPIPTWAYVTTSIVIITILLAFRNRNLKETL